MTSEHLIRLVTDCDSHTRFEVHDRARHRHDAINDRGIHSWRLSGLEQRAEQDRSVRAQQHLLTDSLLAQGETGPPRRLRCSVSPSLTKYAQAAAGGCNN